MRKIIALVFVVLFFIILIYTAIYLRPFGEIRESTMDDYIIENAQNETGANNAVTSVVFDYRGFDTLGEATVLFTAVAGVLLTLRRYVHE